MKLFKFTYIAKQCYDVEIEATTLEEAKAKFDQKLDNDQIDWENPDYLESETYHEWKEII